MTYNTNQISAPHLLIVIIGTLWLTLLSGCVCAKEGLHKSGQQSISIPEPGETITIERAIVLSRHYGFDYLVERLENHPDRYKDWKFDGVSMAPDNLFSWLFCIPNMTEIALRHDLKYAYGEKGNEAEKEEADLALKQEVIADGGAQWVARLMYKTVKKYGKEKYDFSFSWGFAHK